MRISRLVLSLLIAGCAAAPHGPTVTPEVPYSSNSAYDVEVVQTAYPMAAGSQANRVAESGDVSFEIEFTNRSEKAVTIERISLEGKGGTSYRLKSSTRTFGRTVAPGEKVTLKYWANAVIEDRTLPFHSLLTVTALIDTTVEGTAHRETFHRKVNAGGGAAVVTGR
jgi:hypothetical protein